MVLTLPCRIASWLVERALDAALGKPDLPRDFVPVTARIEHYSTDDRFDPYRRPYR